MVSWGLKPNFITDSDVVTMQNVYIGGWCVYILYICIYIYMYIYIYKQKQLSAMS